MPDSSLDWFGRFKNPTLQEEFVLHCIQKRSKFAYLVITILLIVWLTAETVYSTWFSHDYFGQDQVTNEIYGVLCLGLIAVALTLPIILSDFNFQNRLTYSYLQVIYLVTITFIFFLKEIKHIHIPPPPCIPITILNLVIQHAPAAEQVAMEDFLQNSGLPQVCASPESYVNLFSYNSVLIMLLLFQILTPILYEPRVYLLIICDLSSGTIMLYNFYQSFYALVPFLTSFLSILIVIIHLHLQRVQSFLHQRKVQLLFDENERNADANHAMELRSMIGNVAHDLKTPLASFTNGLDMILEVIISAHTKMKMAHLEEKPLTPDMFSECFASIEACATNIRNSNTFMLMTINRCIDYTKASKGMKLVPKYETVDLREALQFPIECMSNIQERIGIKMEALSEEICSHIITDKQWLQENLLCLLSNAVKYSTEGTVTIKGRLCSMMREVQSKTISLFTWSSGHDSKIVPTVADEDDLNEGMSEKVEYLMFEVEDAGIGLSEESMKNLFNPFKQAQRMAGGTGLGLYSLAKRMEALKGRYGVRKREDGKQGSLFWFSIPYKADPVAAASTKDPWFLERSFHEESPNFLIQGNKIKGQLAVAQLDHGKRMRAGDLYKALEILIVDDAPSILKMSSMMLKRQGHEIWTAENGEIALKRIEEKWRESGKGFDLVLMDLQMPVMDGLEATRRLRLMEAEGREWMVRAEGRRRVLAVESQEEIGKCRQLIIGLSANSDHETAKEALIVGMDDFFSKPFSLEAFNKAISKYIFFDE